MFNAAHPYYTYTIAVAAETIGPGPYGAEFTIRMPEDGIYVIYNRSIYCSFIAIIFISFLSLIFKRSADQSSPVSGSSGS